RQSGRSALATEPKRRNRRRPIGGHPVIRYWHQTWGSTMKHLYVLGTALVLAACAQQTAPPPAAMAPPPAPPPMAMMPPPGPPPMAAAMEPLDGVYVGSLTLQSAGLSGDSLNRS